MDYSSLPNDPDHPAGADPWQSSPQPTRTSFPQPESGREPDSPTAKHAPPTPEPQHQEERYGSDQESPNASSYEEPPQQPNGAGRIPSRSDTASDIRFQGPPLTEEELRQQQLYQQRQQEWYQQAIHKQQHARGPGPQRYHPGARAGQRQPPQYKLQAKITGLERTGKKDPAITFDVHVSQYKFWGRSARRKLTGLKDESPKISHHTSQSHKTHTFRVCQVSRSFNLLQSGSLCARSASRSHVRWRRNR